MHTNARLMFERHAVPVFRPGDSVLEVGPSRGNTVLRDMLPAGCAYHYADVRNFDLGPGRVDMPGPYQIHGFDDAFDVVFAAQVIEHVARPWLWVPELARVARRAVILLAPVSYGYHASKGGLDCWRIYADGMKELLRAAELGVEMAWTETIDGVHIDTIGIGTKETTECTLA